MKPTFEAYNAISFLTNLTQLYIASIKMLKLVDGITLVSKNHLLILFLLAVNRYVVTLALGSRPRQGLARVRAKREARESHLMLPGVQKSVRE